MTGGQCQSKEMVMGRGADGGCGTEERPGPLSRATLRPVMPEASTSSPEVDVDFFSQARKALCERSPFDVAEDGSAPATSVPTLPSGLASLLKHSDSKKRQKKPLAGTEKKKKKKSAKPGEKSRGRNIWSETEDYFRDLTLPDIDTLFEISSANRDATRRCFLVPILEGDDTRHYVEHGEEGQDDGFVLKEEDDGRSERDMEVDSLGLGPSALEDQSCSVSDSGSGSEWVLGCRDRVYLNSERPTKKRKLLGSDAGLEKIFTARPSDGNSLVCDLCCKGPGLSDSNPLIVCNSCKVVIHKRCYGVVLDVDGSWLCSWCSQKDKKVESGYPCVLCPKSGGALKPIRSTVEGGLVEFAHLFCSQWMPEIYIEDLMRMEPILNVEGIKETRRKLVCNICKMKCGICVRCSHGTCRTSFHPICAREARHRMEIWGKYGYDSVELRAFCSKHSEVQCSALLLKSESVPVAPDGDSSNANSVSENLSKKETQGSDVDCRTEDDTVVRVEVLNNSQILDNQGALLHDIKIGSAYRSEHNDASQLSQVMVEKGEDVKSSESVNFLLILKKLIDRGKVNVKDVALEIGTSPDSLASTLAGDSLVADLRSKLVKWLKDHAYMAKDLMVKIRRQASTKGDTGAIDDSDSVAVSECVTSDPVAVKSVPPRRRTKSNIRILKDNTLVCSSKNASVLDNIDQVALEEAEVDSVEFSVPGVSKEVDSVQDSLGGNSHISEGGNPDSTFSESSQMSADHADTCGNDKRSQFGAVYKSTEVSNLPIPAAVPSFYMHQYIRKSLLQMQGAKGVGTSGVVSVNSTASLQNEHLKHNSATLSAGGRDSEQLAMPRELGGLQFSPNDEVEGEIVYFQHRLLKNAIARKPLSDNLISRVERALPQEINAARSQRWDAVLINRYLYERREAKKLGRKERKHKEAQAVLAAATAAAAASSRVSSLRKDPLDDSATQEKLLKFNTTNGRAGSYSHLVPRSNEVLQKVGTQRELLEKDPDFSLSGSGLSNELSRSCDICSRSDTVMNPILVCSSCKVAVHLDCYRSVRESTGPWYCELCEELRSSGAADVGFWERPISAAECTLCGGTTGAFRKSIDRQWVHAFCAEWVFEATFRRGQVNPVVGMAVISKGVDECNICRHKYGVCIKCNFGHCQTTFHPSCARSSGLFMNVKTVGGKLQHKAYCGKHSLDQKAKAEAQKYGIEELKSIKQIRVELEKLRLLCERIIKREKVKREIVLCTHDVLALRRNMVARSVIMQSQSPFFPPDGSSDSATTTSLNCKSGNETAQRSDDVTVDSTVSGKRRPKVFFSMGAEQSRSGNETVQRSDDMTVDSTVSGKRRPKVSFTMGSEQRADDSCASQSDHLVQKSTGTGKAPISGKHIPHRYKKHTETLEKELVMTSDQADLKNKLLPKGYAYVPSDCIPKDKWIDQDARSDEPVEDGG